MINKPVFSWWDSLLSAERERDEARAALEELFAQASFVFPADADFMQRARAVLISPELGPPAPLDP